VTANRKAAASPQNVRMLHLLERLVVGRSLPNLQSAAAADARWIKAGAPAWPRFDAAQTRA
jgi:hypothetical protein